MQPYSSERYVLPKRIGDIAIPDSRLSFDAFDVAKSHVSIEVLLHSIRAFAFAALIGKARGVRFDPELLFVSGILHDVGIATEYTTPDNRFEVDGANAARELMNRHDRSGAEADIVWDAIALH